MRYDLPAFLLRWEYRIFSWERNAKGVFSQSYLRVETLIWNITGSRFCSAFYEGPASLLPGRATNSTCSQSTLLCCSLGDRAQCDLPSPQKKKDSFTLSLSSFDSTSRCIFGCFLRHFLKNLLLLVVVVVVSEGIFKRQKNRQDDRDRKEFK